jgi:hypothetical protein
VAGPDADSARDSAALALWDDRQQRLENIDYRPHLMSITWHDRTTSSALEPLDAVAAARAPRGRDGQPHSADNPWAS